MTALRKEIPNDASVCALPLCRHQKILCGILLESIKVLDETRRSFKSKPLEILRKRFLQILTEEMNHASSERNLQINQSG
jgi:hypothetical protein